ncbi:unnamed protein product [Fraxinus pennsylvanica]|uniref:Uncharacterized protein n=1 Tax=Fraxinus pennsylvanica TaxID=56036 RepID=A0AAD2DUH5_9LAMI|nr:unnamed protein product [Fraxinus pennsylvanica]
MPAAKTTHEIIATVLIIATLAATTQSGGNPSITAYELLQSYDFPVGLLPEGVTHYDIDEATGKFNAYFKGSCSFSLEGSYQLKYNSKIGGYISKGKLTSLSGVSVKLFFLWVNIVEVVRNGDNLEFSVGIASADFSIDNFYECPRCGCGLKCKGVYMNAPKGDFRINSYASSI